jgi:hypothetical protein
MKTENRQRASSDTINIPPPVVFLQLSRSNEWAMQLVKSKSKMMSYLVSITRSFLKLTKL